VAEDEIGKEVVDTAVHIHQEIGPDLLELVYEVVLAHELRGKGLRLADKRLGYLLNFGEVLMKHGITRIVNRLQEQGLIPWRSWRLREREGFSSAPTNSADEPLFSEGKSNKMRARQALDPTASEHRLGASSTMRQKA